MSLGGRVAVLTPALVPNASLGSDASSEHVAGACYAGNGIYCPQNCSSLYYVCSAEGLASAMQVLPSGLVCARGRIEFFGRATLRRGEIRQCLGVPGVTLRADEDYDALCSAAPDGDYCSAPCARSIFACAGGRAGQVIRLGQDFRCLNGLVVAENTAVCVAQVGRR